jgi:hypothetical protein
LVIFLDELDMLLGANPAVKDDFLNFLRGLKHEKRVKAVVGIGSYEVLRLGAPELADGDDPARASTALRSPFNVSDGFGEQHFLLEEVKAVVNEYVAEHHVTLPESFVEDLYGSTHGYAASLAMCLMNTQSRHPGLTMMALHEYDNTVVRLAGKNFNGVRPDWTGFCRAHFWPFITVHESLRSAVNNIAKSDLCRAFLTRRNLLCTQGNFGVGMCLFLLHIN